MIAPLSDKYEVCVVASIDSASLCMRVLCQELKTGSVDRISEPVEPAMLRGIPSREKLVDFLRKKVVAGAV